MSEVSGGVLSIAWVDDLQRLLDAEGAGVPKIAVFATVDSSGLPHSRCVVIREIRPDGTAVFATDARSEKVRHLTERPAVELVFWLPGSRVQVRVAGDARQLDNPEEIRRHWREISPASRATFTWPMPGEPRAMSEAFDHPAPADPPSTLALVEVTPLVVDYLSLRETPHTRWIFRAGDDWVPHAVNP